MAQGRMLNKYISTSETVNNLSYEAMLIYTWLIPHTDDVGLVPKSPRKLKAIIAPMWDMPMETFGNQLETIVQAGLLKPVEQNGEEFYYLVGHSSEQTLKRDRKPRSIASDLDDWKKVETIWNQLEPNGGLSKEKISKEKLNTGDERPVISEKPQDGKPNSLKSILSARIQPTQNSVPSKQAGISTPWQDKAFRYAEKLGIRLTGSLTGRWLKVFKQASGGRKSANLEKAYSFLSDHPDRITMTTEEVVNYFFHIYENGLTNNFLKKEGA